MRRSEVAVHHLLALHRHVPGGDQRLGTLNVFESLEELRSPGLSETVICSPRKLVASIWKRLTPPAGKLDREKLARVCVTWATPPLARTASLGDACTNVRVKLTLRAPAKLRPGSHWISAVRMVLPPSFREVTLSTPRSASA